MRNSWRVLSLVVAGALLALTGCGGGSGGGGDGGSGDSSGAKTLKVVVTDAPFSFGSVKSATVEVQRIDLHAEGAGEDTLQTLVTFSPGRVIDLVHLQNGVVETLFEGNPPPGSYDSVRIVVLPVEIVVDDNGVEKSFPFKVPSGPQTGIKVQVSPSISVVTNLTTDLVLDFDLSRSFVVQGNPATPAGIKGFHFKPVVRAINRSTAGTLSFLVNGDSGTPATADDVGLDGASCEVTDADGALVAASVSGPKPTAPSIHGYVAIPAIPAGTYTVTVAALGYKPETKTQVTIVAANLTDLGTVLLEKVATIAGVVTTKIQPRDPTLDPLEFAVPGATVEAGGVSVSTDSTGVYQIAGLLPGPYTVQAQKVGYDLASAAAVVLDGSVTVTNFELTPKTAAVTGTVKNVAGEAQAGATVAASVEYGTPFAPVVIAEATSAADGSYLLALPTGSYDIGVGSATTPLDVVGGTGPVTLNITVP